MRQIKFRAWDKERDRMIYPDQTDIALFEVTENGMRLIDIEYTEDSSFPSYIDAIIMQSTGLFDKNGVEIYEEDIVKHHNNILSTVFYNTSHCAYLLQDINGNRSKRQFDKLGNYSSLSIEVIGNIHENPELLEVER